MREATQPPSDRNNSHPSRHLNIEATVAGKQEILYRRVGRNELTAIQVCRELGDAEKEYYAEPHDGDAGSEYARRLFSDPSKHNGLCWASASGETGSPVGPLLAAAEIEDSARGQNQPQPFQAITIES